MRFIILRSPVKPCLVKYSSGCFNVVKGQRVVAKGSFIVRPDTKGTLEAPKGTMPFGRRTLLVVHDHSSVAKSREVR